MPDKIEDEVAALLFDAEDDDDDNDDDDEREDSSVRERLRDETLLRRVPWASWAEWCAVRDAFCAGTAEGARAGVARVQVWRARGGVPVSVDATASLAAFLHGAAPAGSDAAAAAALALIRFVNGLTETAQTGAYAVSVSTAAARVGLPVALVEYRHQATHALLPDAAATARAARAAYAWLLAHYWAPQAAAVGDAAGRVAALLDAYRTRARAHAAAPARAALRGVVALVDRVTGGAGVTELLVPALVRGGLLVPRTARPRVFAAVPPALQRLWRPALAHFARAWDHFPSALCMLLAQRVAELARTTVAHAARAPADPLRFAPASQYEQSLLAAWFAHLVAAFAPALARDRSAQLATLAAVFAAAYPPRSVWTERAAWAAIASTAPATRQRLAQLKAILQSTDSRSTSVGLLVAGRVDLSGSGAGGRTAALPLDVIERHTARLVAAAAAADAAAAAAEAVVDGNAGSGNSGSGNSGDGGKEAAGGAWPLVRGIPRPIGLDENGELPALDVPDGAAFAPVAFVPTHDMPRAAWAPLSDSDYACPVVDLVEPGESDAKRRRTGNDGDEVEVGESDSEGGDDDDGCAIDEGDEGEEEVPVLEREEQSKALDAALQTLIGVL